VRQNNSLAVVTNMAVTIDKSKFDMEAFLKMKCVLFLLSLALTYGFNP
jgi:hypothetical protein